MPRRNNAIRSERVVVVVTPQIYKMLTEIVKSGYGAKTVPSAAEEMIRKGLDASGLISDLLRRKLTDNGKQLKRRKF